LTEGSISGNFGVATQRISSASADNKARPSWRVFAFLGFSFSQKIADMRGANHSAHPAMLPRFC
jgi:uncharacterized protein (DUF924 family)